MATVVFSPLDTAVAEAGDACAAPATPPSTDVDKTKLADDDDDDAEEELFKTQCAQSPRVFDPVSDSEAEAEAEAEEPPLKRRRLSGSKVEEWLAAAETFRVRDLAAQPPAVRHAIVDLAAAIAASKRDS